MKKLTVMKIADGYCPNKDCSFDGDIECVDTIQEGNGYLKQKLICHACETEWTIIYKANVNINNIVIKNKRKGDLI